MLHEHCATKMEYTQHTIRQPGNHNQLGGTLSAHQGSDSAAGNDDTGLSSSISACSVSGCEMCSSPRRVKSSTDARETSVQPGGKGDPRCKNDESRLRTH